MRFDRCIATTVRLRLAPAAALIALGVLGACGPKVLGLHAQQPDSCSAEYRFTATLSGNVLAFTLAKDTPGEGEDEIPAVLTYKQSVAGASFELTPDPTGAGDIEDAPPAMQAQVDGDRACLAPMDS